MSRDELDRLLREGARDGFFSCASYAAVSTRGSVLGGVGRVDGATVTERTPFDLASLTKVVATTTVAFVAVCHGQVSLDERVSRFLPYFEHRGVTIRHLLSHTSGLPAYLDLTSGPQYPTEEVWRRIAAVPLVREPGSAVEYSCLGFIVLSKAMEAACGQAFDRLFDCWVKSPLGLCETGFRPGDSTDLAVPPTARTEPWRGIGAPIVQGVVHDPLTWMLGGVSGNAGLFGSANDLARFALAVIGRQGPFAHPDWPNWTQRRTDGQERGLGWDFKSTSLSSAGALMSSASYGHTGFTGTMVWIDPTVEVAVVLLSNAVWTGPDRDAWRLFRSRFCDAALRTHGRPDP